MLLTPTTLRQATAVDVRNEIDSDAPRTYGPVHFENVDASVKVCGFAGEVASPGFTASVPSEPVQLARAPGGRPTVTGPDSVSGLTPRAFRAVTAQR